MKVKIVYLDNLPVHAMLYSETWVEKLLLYFIGTMAEIKS